MLGYDGFYTEAPGIGGKLRYFKVIEVPKFFPSGSGAWVWFFVEKRFTSTLDLAKFFARKAGISLKLVGYAGLKDKHAIAYQWFSLPEKAFEKVPKSTEVYRILAWKRHPRKLRTGALLGNFFEVKIEAEEPGNLRQVIEEVKLGIPNLFGIQRFGVFEQNTHLIGRAIVKKNYEEAARLILSYPRKTWIERKVESKLKFGAERAVLSLPKKLLYLYHDAYTAYLFNRVLKLRKTIDPIEGDIIGKFGPTAPVFGKKVKLASKRAGEIERKVLKEEGVRLEDFWGKGKRRPVKLLPEKLSYSFSGKFVELKFFLPKGSYASVLLWEIMKPESFENITWLI